jgi:CRISPR/Cas system CSM-associated protein Csm3 (group 7 of RAMP superfamily)
MTPVTITFTWKVDAPLHVGTGISRAGGADRTIRRRGEEAILPGDAVKGALRGAAEQIESWLLGEDKIADTGNVPTNHVLRRIFAGRHSPGEEPILFRFKPASSSQAKHDVSRLSFTRIDESGVAEDNTLRVIEAANRGVEFKIEIQCFAPGEPASIDDDLLFLGACILATEAVAGKKALGWGHVECSEPACQGRHIDFAELAKPEGIARLRRHLRAGLETGREEAA